MTSVETTGLASRRKWGWIFIALLFTEMVAFSIIAVSLTEKIEQLRGFLKAGLGLPVFTQIQIDNRIKQLNELYLISGLSLAGTLVCAAIGFRRRKIPAE